MSTITIVLVALFYILIGVLVFIEYSKRPTGWISDLSDNMKVPVKILLAIFWPLSVIAALLLLAAQFVLIILIPIARLFRTDDEYADYDENVL